MKTINEIVEKIKETNEVFEAATPEQKRVMIAEDVIDWVLSKRLTPVKSRVVIFGKTTFRSGKTDRTARLTEAYLERVHVSKEASVQELLFAGEVSCEVCAKGALFMSIIGKVNKMTVGEMDFSCNPRTPEMQKINEYFSEDQMALIEAAFEGSQQVFRYMNGDTLTIPDEEANKAYEFYITHGNSEDCLLAIMQNIIHNNGEFVL